MADPSVSVSDALEGLLTRFGELLRRVGRGRGLSQVDVDELCQEVRVRLWRALASGEKIADASASYVYRTAVSAAVDMIRRRRARPETPLSEFSGEEPASQSRGWGTAPDDVLERRHFAEQLASALDELPERRNVVVRLHLTGYHRTEIAQLLGWTEAKTRSLLYRGLADLRTNLTRRGIGPRVGRRG